jgi:hypothetical protein
MPAGTDTTAQATDPVACEKCGQQGSPEEMTTHHILPPAFGGTDDSDNVATLCAHCARYAPDDFLDPDEYEPVFEDYVATDVRPEVDFAYFGVIATEKLATAYRDAAGGITGELDADELVASIDPIVNTVQSLPATEDEHSPAYYWILYARFAEYGRVTEADPLTEKYIDDGVPD